MQENYCDECDEVLHSLVDAEDFAAFRAGPVRCLCGHVVMPCNECRIELDEEQDCSNCPFRNAAVSTPLTDEEYVAWVKANELDGFLLMLEGGMGDAYQKVAKEINNK